MGLTINFIGSHATIKHINLRKQGNDEDKVLAIDIKIEGETEASILNDILGASIGDDLTDMFWSQVPGSDPKSLRTHWLKSIEIDSEWPIRIVRLGKHETRGDVKKISFRPRPGHRLDLTASISIEGPQKELLDYLVSKIQENITCRIDSQPELALGQGGANG